VASGANLRQHDPFEQRAVRCGRALREEPRELDIELLVEQLIARLEGTELGMPCRIARVGGWTVHQTVPLSPCPW
jgi:hypothetical protein